MEIIRKMIRGILQEGMATLPHRALLKAWVNEIEKNSSDSSAHTHRQMTVQGNEPMKRQDIMTYKVGRFGGTNVFQALTPDVQAWVLQHWGDKAIFTSFIEGVSIGLFRESQSFTGMAFGDYQAKKIRPAHNGMMEMITSTDGFLVIRVQLDSRDGKNKLNRKSWQKLLKSGGVPFELFLSQIREDLEKSDSIFVHEFHHWFQKSAYHLDNRMKKKRYQKHQRSEQFPHGGFPRPEGHQGPYDHLQFDNYDLQKMEKHLGTGRSWENLGSEWDAERARFIDGFLRTGIFSNPQFQKDIVMSNSDGVFGFLYGSMDKRLKDRFTRKLYKKNIERLESFVDRIADRIIEKAEEYTHEDHNPNSEPEFVNWLESGEESWTVDDYFQTLYSKITGEIA